MLILRREAEEDIRNAYLWYEEQQPGLGDRFLAAVDRTLSSIAANPLIHNFASPPIRRALCARFPYAVYFIEGNESLIVIAVLHQRQKPKVWRTRSLG